MIVSWLAMIRRMDSGLSESMDFELFLLLIGVWEGLGDGKRRGFLGFKLIYEKFFNK
jgi:hypothetical protein